MSRADDEREERQAAHAATLLGASWPYFGTLMQDSDCPVCNKKMLWHFVTGADGETGIQCRDCGTCFGLFPK
jgi:hypothetical protein